jgi:Chaperone of endosialidase
MKPAALTARNNKIRLIQTRRIIVTSLHHPARRHGVLLSAIAVSALPGFSLGQQPPNVVMSDEYSNTAMGTDALLNVTPFQPSKGYGARNTAAGWGALQDNTSGYQNSAFGTLALGSNTTGGSNVACGAFALGDNQTGDANTASGYEALQQNTSGSQNTADGVGALTSNHSGDNNTASGAGALGLNLTGNNNTASGFDALLSNITGAYNTAAGSAAMRANATGSNNTAVGVNALGANQGGSNNVAIGASAGYYVRGGRYNIEIGNLGTAQDAGTIRVGTPGQQGSTYIAGIASSQVTGSAVYVTSMGQLGVLASSERYKTAVAPMGSTTGRLKELRPVTFRLKTDPKGGRQYGLIAEEVARVYPELVIRGRKGEIEGVRYEELTPMLLNELQHQQGRLAAQQAELKAMRSQLGDLRRAMQERTH